VGLVVVGGTGVVGSTGVVGGTGVVGSTGVVGGTGVVGSTGVVGGPSVVDGFGLHLLSLHSSPVRQPHVASQAWPFPLHWQLLIINPWQH